VQRSTKFITALLIIVLALRSPLLALAQNLSAKNRQILQTLINSELGSTPLGERVQFRHPLATLNFFKLNQS